MAARTPVLHGISLGGSTGEPSAQTVAERIRAMRVVAEEVADRVPFVPGTGSAKLDETLELTEAAIDLGADIALVITPYYSRPTQDGLYQWYSAVAARFPDIPIVLYNVPIRTAVDVAPETVARLRRAHDNIVGIKETTKDFEHFSSVFHLCGRDTARCGRASSCCACPCSPSAGSVSSARWPTSHRGRSPTCTTAGSTATRRGRVDIHYGLHPLVDLMFVETNPAPIKSVLQPRRADRIRATCVRRWSRRPPPGWPASSGCSSKGAPVLEAPLPSSPIAAGRA